MQELSIVLENALPSGPEFRPLEIHITFNRRRPVAVVSMSPLWNQATHDVDLSGLTWNGRTLSGRVSLTLQPDHWIPTTRQPLPASFAVEASTRAGVLAGTFTGQVEATCTHGRVSGTVHPRDKSAPRDAAIAVELMNALTFGTGMKKDVPLDISLTEGRVSAAEADGQTLAPDRFTFDGFLLTGAFTLSFRGQPDHAIEFQASLADQRLGGPLSVTAGPLRQTGRVRGDIIQPLTVNPDTPPSLGPVHADPDQLARVRILTRRTRNSIRRFETGTFTAHGDTVLPYRYFRPRAMSPGPVYPLVLFLHGADGRGNDNTQSFNGGNMVGAGVWTLPEIQERHACFVVVPQCPRDAWWSEVSPPASSEPLRPMADVLLAFLDRFCRDNPVDTGRLYVTGLSMGGFGTYALMIRAPERFAAGIPLCGIPDMTRIQQLVGKPLWIFHGGQDKVVPPDASRSVSQTLREIKPAARYTELSDAGHVISAWAYSEPGLIPWLFGQTTRLR